ncbi:MAG: DUF177 domain-containing protein [Chitinophagales bacterium]|jgi:uncharacterized metal-binding protein YceD (DUF177 family)|nr:DUF177 domain-containing protein [Chitinophagales bacterium]
MENSYKIAFVGLKNKVYRFEFDIDTEFFRKMGYEDFHNAEVLAKLDFDKRENIFELRFEIDGIVTLECDRCNELMDYELMADFTVFVKYLSRETLDADSTDEIIYIPKNETHIDVSKMMYDYILLHKPMKITHEMGIVNKGKPNECDQTILSKLKIQEENTEEEVDPRFKVLEKLKTNLYNE